MTVVLDQSRPSADGQSCQQPRRVERGYCKLAEGMNHAGELLLRVRLGDQPGFAVVVRGATDTLDGAIRRQGSLGPPLDLMVERCIAAIQVAQKSIDHQRPRQAFRDDERIPVESLENLLKLLWPARKNCSV